MKTETYQVVIAGEKAVEDYREIDMGCLTPRQAWWELSIPACPDCSGQVVVFEAGQMRGTRKCTGCGSMFLIDFANRGVSPERRVVMTRLRYY